MPDPENPTPTAAPSRSIAGAWEMQHWLEFEGAEGWGAPLRVTEDPTFDTENDDQTYEPKYLDRKNQPVYIMGRKTSLKFEIDAVLPGDIQAKLAACEDKVNVPVRYTRTLAVDVQTGQALPGTALAAKRAEGTLTMKPIAGEASGPMKLFGTINLTTGYEYGTFNETTKVFSV